MHRFHVLKETIRDGIGRVEGEEFVHLDRVLRLGVGETVALFDETGWEYEGKILSLERGGASVLISGTRASQKESGIEIGLGQALPKGAKMDFIVEKATELGVRRILPFVCQSTVPKSKAERDERKIVRWRRIALSATKQCGRSRVPEINRISGFEDLISASSDVSLKLIFWEKEEDLTISQLAERGLKPTSVTLLVGAEGGFSVDEIEKAKSEGFLSIGLGLRTLRCETAAVVSIALIQHLWGDLS